MLLVAFSLVGSGFGCRYRRRRHRLRPRVGPFLHQQERRAAADQRQHQQRQCGDKDQLLLAPWPGPGLLQRVQERWPWNPSGAHAALGRATLQRHLDESIIRVACGRSSRNKRPFGRLRLQPALASPARQACGTAGVLHRLHIAARGEPAPLAVALSPAPGWRIARLAAHAGACDAPALAQSPARRCWLCPAQA